MAKGKATVNQFKTNSSIGFRMIIPKRIVDEFQIKDKEIFCQKLIDGHIEMERPIRGGANISDKIHVKTEIGNYVI